MIRVERGLAPAGFAERSKAWLDGFDENVCTMTAYWGDVRSQINDDAAILKERFHFKCAFCEGDAVEYCSALEVEHFYPKGDPIYQNRAFDWDNWLVACPRCNRSKGKKLLVRNGTPELINPCDENPSRHLTFENSTILSQTPRGKYAIKKVNLDRIALQKARDKHLLLVDCLIIIYFEIPKASDEAYNLLIWSVQDNAPFTAMTRSYLRGIEELDQLVAPPIPLPRVHLEAPLQRMRDLCQHYRRRP